MAQAAFKQDYYYDETEIPVSDNTERKIFCDNLFKKLMDGEQQIRDGKGIPAEQVFAKLNAKYRTKMNLFFQMVLENCLLKTN